MRWLEVCIDTNGEDIDLLCERLAALGADGFVIEDEDDFKGFLEDNRQYWDYVDDELERSFSGVSRVKFYLSNDEKGQVVLDSMYSELGRPFTVTSIEDLDWENNWREYYHPIEVGERLLIVPEWEQAPVTERVVLRLDPGLSFGTGSHATTRMCLAAIEEICRPEARVLDIGCGSGILAIAALLLGCERAVGCDIDPKVPEVACSNAALNGLDLDSIVVYAGDILSDSALRERLETDAGEGGVYDIVLANIVADVIIPLAPIAREFLTDGGHFIASGVIEGRQDEVRQALLDSGFRILSERSEEEWHCFHCARALRRAQY